MAKKQPVTLRDMHKIKKWQEHDFWNIINDAGVFKPGFPARLGNAEGTYEGLINCWKNESCYVIGGGISGRGFNLSKLNDCHTITVNHMIEYYDNSEFHFWQDQRFLRITKYPMDKYKGTCIYHNNNAWIPENNNFYLFKSRNSNDKHIDLDIRKGLFGRVLTGVAAVHLALITGALKVYLIGIDHHNGDLKDGLHYAKDYTGEDNSEKSQYGYGHRMEIINRFLPWKDNIIQVQGDYPGHYFGEMFNTIKMKDLPIVKERK
jgi:hypothetical protein